MWHIRLLDTMVNATDSRPAVISPRLRASLRKYLEFRHVFRHAYSFELQWTRMAPLVVNCLTAFEELKGEMGIFLDYLDKES
jgi:hypothetical protein